MLLKNNEALKELAKTMHYTALISLIKLVKLQIAVLELYGDDVAVEVIRKKSNILLDELEARYLPQQ